MKREWLILWKKVKPAHWCQEIRKVGNTEHDMKETIKYGTKIFTDPTVKKFKGKASPYVYISAMDNILVAIRGRRLFEHFGFKVPKTHRKKNVQKANNYKDWKFDSQNGDWVNFEDEMKVLCGYRLSEKNKKYSD